MTTPWLLLIAWGWEYSYLWYFSDDLLSKSAPKNLKVGWTRLLIYQKGCSLTGSVNIVFKSTISASWSTCTWDDFQVAREEACECRLGRMIFRVTNRSHLYGQLRCLQTTVLFFRNEKHQPFVFCLLGVSAWILNLYLKIQLMEEKPKQPDMDNKSL